MSIKNQNMYDNIQMGKLIILWERYEEVCGENEVRKNELQLKQ